ncbi:unnamed protein product [Penicillium salamii]|nr:unnamed protein product [Penicillium salamii]CAG8280702.1 unnamed protein product [Penicillium salamii]
MSSIASTSRSREKPLIPLSHPVAIRSEHVALEETDLRLYPKANRASAAEYIIKNLATASTLFSVTGKKYGSNTGREFRDSTGLPLFELRRATLPIKPWKVRLPGDKSKDLASISMQGASRKIILKVPQNQSAAADSVTLTVVRTTALFTFEVMTSSQTVAHVQENTEINTSAGEVVSGPYHNVPPRRVLDIRLTEGLDASIVSIHQ